MLNLVSVNKANIFGKKVFLRVDLDVPLSQQTTNNKQQTTIEDDTRLLAWMPTLKFLLDSGAKVIIAGHIGRPKGFDKSLSLEPVAEWLYCHPELNSGSQGMPKRVRHDSTNLKKLSIGEFDGWKLADDLFLLENLRFYEGEEENDLEFAKKLSSLADIYVNDAFAVCHRDHASVAGVPKYLPHFTGLRLQKEVEILGSVLENPARPLVVVIGGAKIETKLPLVEKMRKIADYVLVGGKIARESESFLKINNEIKGNHAELVIADLNKDKTDITQKSLSDFLEVIQNAKTVVWNGPVGLISSKLGEGDTEKGTIGLARGIAKSSAYTIVGGGDTIDFLKKIDLLNKFSFVSNGGGAMLTFLSGKNVPGLEALIPPVKA